MSHVTLNNNHTNSVSEKKSDNKVTITIPDDAIGSSSETLLHKEEAKDMAGPLPNTEQMSRKILRRNSISLPDLNTPLMNALQQLYSGVEADKEQNNGETMDLNEDQVVDDATEVS